MARSFLQEGLQLVYQLKLGKSTLGYSCFHWIQKQNQVWKHIQPRTGEMDAGLSELGAVHSRNLQGWTLYVWIVCSVAKPELLACFADLLSLFLQSHMIYTDQTIPASPHCYLWMPPCKKCLHHCQISRAGPKNGSWSRSIQQGVSEWWPCKSMLYLASLAF